MLLKNAQSLHYLPCKVECVCDGEEARPCTHPARVATFFEPVMRKAEKDSDGRTTGVVGERYTATFRGRPLSGISMKVPAGYIGRVLTESRQKTTDEVIVDCGTPSTNNWECSELPLIWTPEMWPPLYSGNFEMSQNDFLLK